MVRVVAPATLSAGYTFEASVDDHSFVVAVPDGGVKQGQEFEVPYPEEHAMDRGREENEHHDDGDMSERDPEDKSDSADDSDIDYVDSYEEENEKEPVVDSLGAVQGQWRVGLFSCCDVLTQATCWMGLLCQPVLLAQILTRLQLTWKSERGSPEETSMTFNRIVISNLVVLSLGQVPFLGYATTFVFYILFLFSTYKLRRYMRARYGIPNAVMCRKLGQGTEDCLTVTLCGCCATIQMARQTHDDKEYPGHCCTNTGIEIYAPEIDP